MTRRPQFGDRHTREELTLTDESSRQRARADELRRLAHEIETTPALTLHTQAGADTWRGDRPAFCVDALAHHRVGLLDSAAQLRRSAHRHDVHADELDRAAMRSGAPR